MSTKPSSTQVAHVASVRARIGWKALTAAEYQDEGLAFLATPNIKSEQIDFERVNFITRQRFDESPDLKLEVGDVLLAKDGSTLGIANVVRELPRPATVNGSIAVIRPHGMESRFMMYALRSGPVQAVVEQVKDGMGVPHLFQADIKRLVLLQPSAEGQRRIADFLDDQVARIDAVIAARHRQFECLGAEYVSFVSQQIDEASSGGTVPLRRLTVGIEQGWSPTAQTSPAENGEPGVVKLGSVRAGDFRASENKAFNSDVPPDERYLIRQDDLLVTRANTLSLVGDVAVAEVAGSDRLYLSDLIYRVTLDDTDPRFVSLALRAPKVRQLLGTLARGTSQSMAKLRGEDLLALPIPDVPAAAQKALGSRDRLARESLGQRRSQLERSVSLLAEYKQSLITAAVSGELDVTTAGKAMGS